MLPPGGGRLDVEPDAQRRLDRRAPLRDRDLVVQREIDAIESTAAAKHLLGGIDIHDGEIAAKGARQTAGSHDAANRERLVAHHRGQRERPPDRQAITIGEFLGDDDRIGLREKHQRVVDDRLVCVLEVVFAQAPIAGHVDAENQDVPLSRQARAGRRLDDRHRDLDLRDRLHPLEHVFQKPGVTGRHLQLGRAGNAIDGALERKKDRLIRRVHRHKHGDAEHDAGHRQEGSNRVLAQVRPADQA